MSIGAIHFHSFNGENLYKKFDVIYKQIQTFTYFLTFLKILPKYFDLNVKNLKSLKTVNIFER